MTYQVHHADVGTSTHSKYAQTIAAAVAFVMRNHYNPSVEYSFATSPAISSACQGLMQAYQDLSSTPLLLDQAEDAPDLDEADSEDTPERDHDDDDEEYLVHEEVDETEETPAPQSTLHDNRKPHRRSLYLCPIIQPKLTVLLKAIFTQLPTNDLDGRFFNPLTRYLVLASLRDRGQWIPSSQITQKIAALLFTGRLTMSYIMAQHRSEHNGMTQMKYAEFSTKFHPNQQSFTVHSKPSNNISSSLLKLLFLRFTFFCVACPRCNPPSRT
jgi:hypothetical protein